MSDNLPRRPLHESREPRPSRRPSSLTALFGVMVLACAGAYLWANWVPDAASTDGIAVAAPKPNSPKSANGPKPASKTERTAAQKTIAAQLHAFNAGNWKEAVKFQSDGLKGNFDSPEAFGQMIQQVYPVFVNPKKVAYGQALNVAGHIQFAVSLTGEDDSVARVLYSLVKEKGNYRVEAVLGGDTLPPSATGANVV
jgi:hypothetical protein